MGLFYRVFAAAGLLWVLSLFIFLSGHAGILSPLLVVPPSIVVLAVVVAIVLGSIGAVLAEMGWQERVIVVVTTGFVLGVVPLVLTPPTSTDALIHHLAVPKLYAERGRVFEIPFMSFSYMPMGLDYLYLMPIYLGADWLAKPIHGLFGLLTGLLVYDFLKERADRVAGLLGMAIFVSTPLVVRLATSAYVDLGVTLYSGLALFAFIRWTEHNRMHDIALAALATGFALWTKYNGLVTALLIATFILWHGARSASMKRGLRALALYCGLVAIVFMPWLVRNWLWTENPLYPLGMGILGGGGIHSGVSLAPLQRRMVLYGEGLWELAALPVRIFFEGRDSDPARFDGVLNPLFLPFIPLIFLGNGRRGWTLYVGLFTVLYFMFALLTVELALRYILPAFVGLVVLVAAAIRTALQRGGLVPQVVYILLGVMFLYNGFYLAGLYEKYRPLGYIAGIEHREEYLSRVMPDYAVVAWANRNLPEDAKVLFFFTGDRGYYWERRYGYGDRLGGNLIGLVKDSPSAKAMAERLKSMGYTHIFIHNALFERFAYDNFKGEEIGTLKALFRHHLKRLCSEGGFSLYAIVPQ